MTTKANKAPDLRDRLEALDDYYAKSGDRTPGAVVNQRLDPESSPNPDGSPAYYAYSYFDPTEMKAGRIQKLRDDLRSKQYWPATELAGGAEYVPECSTAEVWMTYAEVARQNFAKRKAWHFKNNAVRQAKLAAVRTQARAGVAQSL